MVILDQITKQLATQFLEYGRPVPIIPFFNLTLVHNTGAAFSFLSNAGGWQRWFFAILAAAVSVFIVVWILRLPRGSLWLPLALSLLLGGALGNLVDRLVLGYVVDFIDVYYQHWHWPAFNIADSAITVGAVMLVLDALFLGKKRAENSG